MEVIDLSSDDEKSPPKNQDTASDIVTRKIEVKNDEKNIDVDDVEIVYNSAKSQKRSAVEREDQNHLKMKRIKLSKEADQLGVIQNSPRIQSNATLRKVIKIKPETLSTQCTAALFERDKSDKSDANNSGSTIKRNGNTNDLFHSDVNSEEKLKTLNSSTDNNSFAVNEGASSSKQFLKPQLTIKTKIKVGDSMETNLEPSMEVFESFLDTCKDQDSSKDMKKIISKLRKRYNNLQPSYAKSGHFIELIRKKRDLIANDSRKLYLHISELMAEMKARLVQNRFSVKNQSKQNTIKPGTSAQSGLSDEAGEELDQNESMTINSKNAKRLRILQKTMRLCERRINECEMAEVDFNDENDSHYILAEKYKARMVELYNKYCAITGESPDAARPYLRPKDLSVTLIPSLNHALTSFINMKITKMKKSLVHTKRNAGQLRLTDALIFPDYIDILNCVKKCNEEQNLQMSKLAQEDMAKSAFTELGRYLQHCRQSDYYDTFSLYLEKEDCDPATTDAILAEKLTCNQELGKKKMDQVFQDFVMKQNAAKASENSACENVEDIETGDESMAGSEDQRSETSEDQEIDISFNSHSNGSESDDVNLTAQDNLIQNGHDNVELDKLQDDSNKESDSVIKLDEQPDDQSQKSNKPVKPGKPQGHLDQQRIIDVELDTDVDGNNETTQTKESHDGPDSISVQATDDKSMNMDTSESIEISVVDNVEPRKEERKDCLAKAKAVTMPTETNCIVLDDIKIDKKLNKSVDPSNSTKTVQVPSEIRESVATVTGYKVNVMQAAKTLETNLTDECSTATATTIVIDAPEVTTTIKVIDEEEEKKPTLRLRQFAKPPGSWKDFQSPIKSSNENSNASNKTPDANTVPIKMKKALPVIDLARKFVKLTDPIPVGKTVRLNNGILMDLKEKKSTIMIPTTLNTKGSKINGQSATNVTLHFNSQVKLQPKNASVVSHALKLGKNVIKINETNKVTTVRNNPEVIRIATNKEKVSQSSSPTQTVDNSDKEVFTIEKPASKLRLVSQQTTGSATQKLYHLIAPRSPNDIEGSIVRRIPIVVERGKKTIVQLTNHSLGGSQSQDIIIPANTTVLQNQKPNCGTSPVAGPSLELKVSNINTSTILPKVPHNTYSRVKKVCQAPTDNVPTYLIE